MTADDHRIWRERLGAHVLGQLSDEERIATEAHLEGCPDCRAEANALSPMAAMLERADPDRLSPAPAPPPISAIGSPGASRPSAAPRGGGGCGSASASEPRRRPRRPRSCSRSRSPGRHPPSSRTPRPSPSRGSRRASQSTPASSPAPGAAMSASTSAASGPARCAPSGCGAATGRRSRAGSFRYVYAGESDEAQLSSGLDPPDVKAIGLRAGSRTFVAPISSDAQGSSARREASRGRGGGSPRPSRRGLPLHPDLR